MRSKGTSWWVTLILRLGSFPSARGKWQRSETGKRAWGRVGTWQAPPPGPQEPPQLRGLHCSDGSRPQQTPLAAAVAALLLP